MSDAVSQPLVQVSLIGEAIDHGPAIVLVADDGMRYVAVNQHAADVLGYTRQELLNLRVTDVATSPDTPRQFAEFMKRTETSGVVAIRHKDGADVSVRFAAKRTTVAGLTLYVFVGFVEDEEA